MNHLPGLGVHRKDLATFLSLSHCYFFIVIRAYSKEYEQVRSLLQDTTVSQGPRLPSHTHPVGIQNFARSAVAFGPSLYKNAGITFCRYENNLGDFPDFTEDRIHNGICHRVPVPFLCRRVAEDTQGR